MTSSLDERVAAMWHRDYARAALSKEGTCSD